MFAVSPNLRATFPQLADDLRSTDPHLALPDGVSLRYALYPAPFTRLAGPMSAHRVLSTREDFDTFAEVFFSPLAWVLAPTRFGDSGYLATSTLDRHRWAFADEWPLYGPDVTNVDLRNLARSIPTVRHPMADSPLEWIELYADEITVVLEGAIPA
jgi:hypothetical protein